jgi:ubiquinone/menaquinone biosynthesis C-methylase UbiE
MVSGWLGCCLESQLTKLDTDSKQIIIDVGSGGGQVLRYLVRNGKTAYGMDTDYSCLETHELHKYFIKADANNLPFKDESVDAIVAVNKSRI